MLPSSLTPRLGATALASMLLIGLSACGGGGDIGNDIGNGVQCGLANCKSSSEVAPQDLRLGGNLRREDGRVTADLGFSYRANLLTVVRLDAPDALWLMPGNVPLTPTSDLGGTLAAQVQSSQDAWTIRLQHRGQTLDSTVTLPAAVQIRVAAPASLQRSQGQFGSTLSGPAGLNPQLSLADGECQLADGRTVRWTGYRGGPQARLQTSTADQSQYAVGLEDLQASLDQAAAGATGSPSTPVTVRQCRLGLVWEYSVKGTAATGLSTHSLITGISQARQVLSYANDR
ncbi:hypothetical protein [Pelomonas sp. BJYL3]|uniref:hypothetical protein n=1 Tax=Pelomonas sp. BJYL3 TaxID=2976697 RepID=UPI0022B2F079|nr:hypothetical protein [Pelomonas sp. BJYL3]